MRRLPRLRTERLVLHVPTPADAAAMARYVTDNREHLAPWEPARDEAYYTAEHWRRTFAAGVEACREGTALTFLLRPREDPAGPVLGQCTFSGIARGPLHAARLGYGLAREAEGRGLMREALAAALDHVFTAWNLHRVMANHMPANTRSAALLERLGFAREGRARAYLRIAGRWEDHVLTARVNDAWRPPEPG